MAIRAPLGASGTGDDEFDGRDAIRFEELWAERDVLRNYCLRLVGDPALADDMVQEAFIEAYRQLDRLERRSSFLPWLATVAKRRGLNELRRRRYAATVAEIPESRFDMEPDPADVTVHRDEIALVREAVHSTLTVRERRLLLQRLVAGLSAEEMAAEEGTTPGSIRCVLMRARCKLRESLEGAERWALAPIATTADWLRRRTSGLSLRAQEVGSFASAASVGEVVAAAVVTVTLGAAMVPPSADPSSKVTVAADGALPVLASFSKLGGPETVREAATPVQRSAPDAPVAVAPEASPVVAPANSPASDEPAPSGPSPVPGLPGPPPPEIDPDEPLPHDEPEDPDDAHFHDFDSPRGEAQSEGEGGSDEVFALGTNAGRCTVDCTVLFHTSDSGRTWQRLAAEGIGEASQVMVAPAYPVDNRIYVMGPDGLRISTDGGASFEPVPTAPVTGPAVMSPGFSDGDERIFIGTQPGFIYDAAVDALIPFTGAPLAGTFNHAAFGHAVGEPDVMFVSTLVNGPAGTARAVIFRCQRDEVCSEGALIDRVTRAPRLTAGAAPDGSAMVIAWDGQKIFVSHDAGRSFEKSPTGVEPSAVEDVVVDSHGRLYAAVGSSQTPGGVLTSTDRGATWKLTGAGTPLTSGAAVVLAPRPGVALASPVDSGATGILYSVTGGDSWTKELRR